MAMRQESEPSCLRTAMCTLRETVAASSLASKAFRTAFSLSEVRRALKKHVEDSILAAPCALFFFRKGGITYKNRAKITQIRPR